MSKPVLLFPLHNGTIDTSSFLKLKNKITAITLFEKKVKIIPFFREFALKPSYDKGRG